MILTLMDGLTVNFIFTGDEVTGESAFTLLEFVQQMHKMHLMQSFIRFSVLHELVFIKVPE